jgi:DNA polymerase/3'-5' exonuclease PolX
VALAHAAVSKANVREEQQLDIPRMTHERSIAGAQHYSGSWKGELKPSQAAAQKMVSSNHHHCEQFVKP